MAFRSIQSFPNGLLALYSKQLKLQELQLQRIRKVLPASLARHALHSVIDNNKLTLYTNSSAWGSQLRFYKKEILAAAASIKGGSPVEILQIRILTAQTGLSIERNSKANVPSDESIAMIRHQSQHVSDIELKSALQKLCSTLSKR